MKKTKLAICALVLFAALYGCGSARNYEYTNESPQLYADYDYMHAPPASPVYDSYAMLAEEAEFYAADDQYAYELGGDATYTPAPDAGGMPIPPQQGEAVMQSASTRKIIYTANVSLQTKEFDAGIAIVEEMSGRYQGFIQSSFVQGTSLHDYSGRLHARNASYTVRVPEDKMRVFLAELEEHFNVNSKNIYTDDITASYFDLKSRLDSLAVQRERLMEILVRSEDVEYLLKVERELARVVYEIEVLTSSINRMDDAVSFSTVNLFIEEVVEYTEIQPIHASFGERISRAFSGAWRNFGIFWQELAILLVAMMPFLIVFVPLVIIAALAMRKYRAKKRGRQEVLRQRDDGQKPE